MNKEKLHQKKFYSSPAVDKIIETHADNNGMGYSEALRDIVLKVPIVGRVTVAGNVEWSDPHYFKYITGQDPLDPRD